MFRRLSLCVLLAGLLSACTHWKLQQLTPQEIVAQRQPPAIRVTTVDGTRRVMRTPRVENGRLVGSGLSFALTDISRAEIRQPDQAGTIALVLLSAGLIVGMVAASQACVSYGC